MGIPVGLAANLAHQAEASLAGLADRAANLAAHRAVDSLAGLAESRVHPEADNPGDPVGSQGDQAADRGGSQVALAANLVHREAGRAAKRADRARPVAARIKQPQFTEGRSSASAPLFSRSAKGR